MVYWCRWEISCSKGTTNLTDLFKHIISVFFPEDLNTATIFCSDNSVNRLTSCWRFNLVVIIRCTYNLHFYKGGSNSSPWFYQMPCTNDLEELLSLLAFRVLGWYFANIWLRINFGFEFLNPENNKRRSNSPWGHLVIKSESWDWAVCVTTCFTLASSILAMPTFLFAKTFLPTSN